MIRSYAAVQHWKFNRVGLWRAIEGRMRTEGLSLREAAREIGVGTSTLHRIGHESPGVHTVVKVCQWLRMTTDAFVERGQ